MAAKTIDITARIANLDKLKQQLQGMTVNVKLESSQLDQLLKVSKTGLKINVKLDFGKELQQLLDLQKKGITLRTGAGAKTSVREQFGPNAPVDLLKTRNTIANARADQLAAAEEIAFRKRVTQQHFQRIADRNVNDRQLKAYMESSIKRDQEYLKTIKNASSGNAFGSSFSLEEPGLGTSSRVNYSQTLRRQALIAKQQKAEALLERRIEEANRRIADSPIEFLLGGGSELIGKEASKLGVNPSRLRQSPSFFDPRRLRDPGNARDVLFSTLLGGPVQGAGAALGAVTLGGPLGALVGGTVAEGAIRSFERIGEALKEATRAADEFDRAAAAITGGLLSTSRVVDATTGQRVSGLDEISIQQTRGRALQSAATRELLNLGIGGESAAALSGALIHTRTTQGFTPSPETVALLSRRFGAFKELAAPDISPNRLGIDINDIIGQTQNAKSTALGSRLLRVAPELFTGRKLDDEALIKATESLDKYVVAIKESGDAFRQRAIIEGQLKNAQRELGEVVNRITLPALAALAGFLEGLGEQLKKQFPGLFPKDEDKSKGTVTETNPDVEIKRLLDSIGVDSIKELEDFKKKSPEFRTSIIDDALARINGDKELEGLFDQFSLLRDKLEQLIVAQENLAKTFDTFKFDQLIEQARFKVSSSEGIVDTARASLDAAESSLGTALQDGNAEAIRAAQAKVAAAEQDLAKALIARSNAERAVTEAIVQRSQAERKLRNAGEAVEDQTKNEVLQRNALNRSIEETTAALQEFASNERAQRSAKEGGILGAAQNVLDLGGDVPGALRSILEDPEQKRQFQLKAASDRLNAELESVGDTGLQRQGTSVDLFGNTSGSFNIGIKHRFEELQDSLKRTKDELDKLPRSLRDLKEALDDLNKLLRPRLDGKIPDELKVLQPATPPGGTTGRSPAYGTPQGPASNLPYSKLPDGRPANVDINGNPVSDFAKDGSYIRGEKPGNKERLKANFPHIYDGSQPEGSPFSINGTPISYQPPDYFKNNSEYYKVLEDYTKALPAEYQDGLPSQATNTFDGVGGLKGMRPSLDTKLSRERLTGDEISALPEDERVRYLKTGLVHPASLKMIRGTGDKSFIKAGQGVQFDYDSGGGVAPQNLTDFDKGAGKLFGYDPTKTGFNFPEHMNMSTGEVIPDVSGSTDTQGNLIKFLNVPKIRQDVDSQVLPKSDPRFDSSYNTADPTDAIRFGSGYNTDLLPAVVAGAESLPFGLDKAPSVQKIAGKFDPTLIKLSDTVGTKNQSSYRELQQLQSQFSGSNADSIVQGQLDAYYGAGDGRISGQSKKQVDDAAKALQKWSDDKKLNGPANATEGNSVFDKLSAQLPKPLDKSETTQAFLDALNAAFV